MSSGKLGTASTVTDSVISVYAVPSGKIATFNILIVNRGTTSAKVSVALSTDDTIGDDEWIEYDVTIPASGVLERTAIIASATEKVYVKANTALCSVRVNGYEETAI